MQVERLKTQTCCGTTGLALKLDKTVSKDFLPLLVDAGFIEAKHFTQSGILYVENQALVATGNFGSVLLNIKCKINNCTEFINNFIELLATME